MMKNMGQLFKQAQQMQAKMAALKSELGDKEVQTSVGGGSIEVKANGKQEIVSLSISPEFLKQEDNEVIEELLKTAINDVMKQSKDMVSQAMSKVTGGLNLPGGL